MFGFKQPISIISFFVTLVWPTPTWNWPPWWSNVLLDNTGLGSVRTFHLSETASKDFPQHMHLSKLPKPLRTQHNSSLQTFHAAPLSSIDIAGWGSNMVCGSPPHQPRGGKARRAKRLYRNKVHCQLGVAKRTTQSTVVDSWLNLHLSWCQF